MRKSIITDDMEHCYLCGRPRECVHHIFFGPLRHIADKLRLVVPLCNDCHMFGSHCGTSEQRNRP